MFRNRPYHPPQTAQMTRTEGGAFELLRPQHKPWVTRVLIAAIVLVFLAQVAMPSLTDQFAMDPEAMRQGEWWRAITGAFLHGGWFHLAGNAFFGYQIGERVERYVGPVRWLVVTLVSLAGAGLAIGLGNVPAVGFSGVLYGWLASWLGFHLTPRFPGLRLSGPQRSAYLQLLVANVIFSLLPGISFLGHLGGFVAGFVVSLALGVGGRKG